MSNPQKPLSNYQWFPFINNSGETIPPFSIFQIDGIDTTGNQIVYKAIKPTWAGAQYAVNGPIQVTSGKRGECCLGPIFIVKYTGTVVVNDFVGPVVSTWTVARGVGTFKVLGIGDSTNNLASVRIPESNAIQFKAPSGGIPARVSSLEGSSATCDILTHSSVGVIALTGVSVTVYNWAEEAVCADGDRYGVANWCGGQWEVVSEDCTSPSAPTVSGIGYIAPLSTVPGENTFNAVSGSGSIGVFETDLEEFLSSVEADGAVTMAGITTASTATAVV